MHVPPLPLLTGARVGQGNIQVLCRVRPVLPHEKAQTSEMARSCFEFPIANDVILEGEDGNMRRFEFDRVCVEGACTLYVTCACSFAQCVCAAHRVWYHGSCRGGGISRSRL